MAIQISRRHFNVDDFYRMAEVGILSPGDRVELIHGEVLEMSPIGSRHAAGVDRLNRLLNKRIGQQAIVRVQNPIRLSDDSEPQPDICLVRFQDDFYAANHPTPADVLLIVEVADSSVELDREVKLPLYATALIPEFWLVNLPDDLIEMYSSPKDGLYQKSQKVKPSEILKSHTISGLSVKAALILG